MNSNNDLRVIKTKKNLYEALLLLMKEEAFENIKISDICKKALVNRTTFYTHFNDKYDLLMSLIDNLKGKLLDDLKINEPNFNTKEYFIKMLEIFVNYIDDNREELTSILSNNRNGILMDILLSILNKDINEKLKQSNEVINGIIPEEIVTKFYLGVMLGIGMEWIINRNKYSKEEMINYLNILLPNNL